MLQLAGSWLGRSRVRTLIGRDLTRSGPVGSDTICGMWTLRCLIRRHGRWLAVSFGLAIVIAFFFGYWGVCLGYAAFNGAGAVLYIDGLDPRQGRDRRHARVFELLAALLLPVGVFGLLASKPGGDPTADALGDEKIRNHVSGSALYGRRSGRG